MSKGKTPTFAPKDETGEAEVTEVTNEVEEIPSEETVTEEKPKVVPDGYREVADGVYARSRDDA